MVGGEQEQLLSQRGEHTAYVLKRKGIIKLALRHGVPLVPCYCFGETDLYHHSKIGLGLRQKIAKTFGVAITLAYGRIALLPFLPIPTRLVQVVGTPIQVEKVSSPTEEDIERVQAAYIRGLREVFESHKAKLGYPDAQLVIV
jgi:1-acyl-sn-glycerol-3-phosphate acyltransferase